MIACMTSAFQHHITLPLRLSNHINSFSHRTIFPSFPILTPSYRSFPSRFHKPLIRSQLNPSSNNEEQSDWREEDPLLTRLDNIPQVDSSSSKATGSSQLSIFFNFLSNDFSPLVDNFLDHPLRLVTASAISILFGYFSATSASTIIGSVADWDPLAAAVLLIWTEGFTKYYYRLSNRSRFLQLLNAFKIGLIYGMTIDAFKLST